jgi:hypothetical protein
MWLQRGEFGLEGGMLAALKQTCRLGFHCSTDSAGIVQRSDRRSHILEGTGHVAAGPRTCLSLCMCASEGPLSRL